MDLVPSNKVPVVTTPDFVIYAEKYAGKIWLHSDVFKWTSKIKAQFIDRLDCIGLGFRQPVFAVNEPEGYDKRLKFMKLVGFDFVGKYNFGNNEFRDVFIRRQQWEV